MKLELWLLTTSRKQTITMQQGSSLLQKQMNRGERNKTEADKTNSIQKSFSSPSMDVSKN